MIDFRYHLVSLVAVFLALAIGIVLGAGPLQGNLADTLTSQVEQLRQDRDRMRSENAQLTTRNEELAAFTQASAPALVRGALTGQSVTIVVDDPSLEESAASIARLAEVAGAKDVTTLTLQPSMWDPKAETSRREALDEIDSTWPAVPTGGENTSAALGNVLAFALSSSKAPGAPALTTAERSAIIEKLARRGFVTSPTTQVRAASAILFLEAPASAFVSEGEPAEVAGARASARDAAGIAFATTLVDGSTPLVVAGSTTPAGAEGFVATVRSSGDLSQEVGTVDTVASESGPTVAVLALGEAVTGTSGHYGIGPGTDGLVPQVIGTLQAPDRSRASDGGER